MGKRPKLVITPEYEAQLERFRDALKSIRSAETIGVYVDRGARVFCHWLNLRGLEISNLHRLALQEFVTWMFTERGIGASTLHPMLAGVKRFIEWQKDVGVVVPELKDPEFPRAVGHNPPPLLKNLRQLEGFIKTVMASDIEEPIRTLCLVLPFCGLRISEAIQLRWDDVKVSERVGAYPWTTIQIRGLTAKFKKSRKTVLLPAGKLALEAYWPELFGVKDRSGWRSDVLGSPWLFPSRTDLMKHVHRSTVEKALEDLKPVLGHRITPHGLRRTFATLLARAGVPIEVTANLMGHKSIQTTHESYVFVQDEDVLDHLDRKMKPRDPDPDPNGNGGASAPPTEAA
jgi:integrase